ncbi:isoprenoid synthase domain-containing protein [Xylariaceae sp. FL0804]|nr:isoprenoid synthase domain-containing protein [Xylariaceae sp. FL0804]
MTEITPPTSEPGDHVALAARLRPLYNQFFEDLRLQPFERSESEKLKGAIFQCAKETGVPYPPNSHSYSALMVGYSYADYCFPYHALEVKVFVAIYTWLATLCDDAERVGTIPDVELFQQRWILGEPQPTIILQTWAEQLKVACKLYHPLIVNLIVTASFNLLTSTALVARNGIKDKTTSPSKGGGAFAWYIREKDDDGEAYALFTFPKAQYPELDIPIEAIDDMGRFIAFANDVLSFYKETLAGEVNNYIRSEAAYGDGDIFTTLKETAQGAIDCERRIASVLAGKGEYEEAWRLHAAGYIQMHVP